jgi:hypothetical protein
MFAESQIFGRSAKLALKAIGAPAIRGLPCQPLTDDARFGLEWVLKRLVEAPPREIRARARVSETLLLFIDGACEPAADNWCSAVRQLWGRRGLKFFGLRLPDEVTAVWSGGVKQNLVFEAEVLPYNLALSCWGGLLRDRHVLVFIDNDGARHSWIKGSADSRHARRMSHQGTLPESDLNPTPYFCMVPTTSNLADGPSRLDFGVCLQLGAEETAVDFAVLRECALAGRPGDG